MYFKFSLKSQTQRTNCKHSRHLFTFNVQEISTSSECCTADIPLKERKVSRCLWYCQFYKVKCWSLNISSSRKKKVKKNGIFSSLLSLYLYIFHSLSYINLFGSVHSFCNYTTVTITVTNFITHQKAMQTQIKNKSFQWIAASRISHAGYCQR